MFFERMLNGTEKATETDISNTIGVRSLFENAEQLRDGRWYYNSL
jgi:hypothetical protein